MGRLGAWRRQTVQITLTGSNDLDDVVIQLPAQQDGHTLVRAIGSITYNIEPNESTDRVYMWAGLFAGPPQTVDPRDPNAQVVNDWLWWDHYVDHAYQIFGAQTADHRYGSFYGHKEFDVHGARIMRPVSNGDTLRLYFAQGNSGGDLPASVNLFAGLACFFLEPEPA